jgi:cytochrome c peroxidase
MKISKLLVASVVASSFLLGNVAVDTASVAQSAKKVGLVAIPADKAELSKLIDPNKTITDEKVELGKKLFFEPRLSKSGIISCNTCHNLGMGGVDGVAAAVGHQWTPNPHHLNSPTVYNSVFFTAQFWDGRSPHLEDQAQGPMQAGPEMAAPKSLVEERVNSMPAYVEEFKKAYGKDVKVEKEGLKTFIDKGCVSCHTGIALGGTMQPFELAAKYKFAHIGDFKGDAKGMVKTPTLRNITETAPYFHNGAIWNLADAVKEMGSTQLGIKISDEEAAKIVTFFGALEGRKPEVSYPQLPKSTATTPKPDFN